VNIERASSIGMLGCAALMVATLSGCGRADSAMQSRDMAAKSIVTPAHSTPEGISLVDVSREMGASQPEYLWTRIGDAEANTLLISANDQPGKSSCVGECAKEFVPFAAAAGAKAYGDWSLVSRADGISQWAYQGKPLYRYAKESRLGELVDNVVAEEAKKTKGALSGFRRQKKEEAPPLLPPEGWSIARFTPGANVPRPPGIEIRPVVVEEGTGVGLVTVDGMTLYGYTGDPEDAVEAECVDGDTCLTKFVPAVVPVAFRGTVGDFAAIDREADKSRQWTFRGVPLYTFTGDVKPGDTNGAYGGDGTWKAVLLSIDPYPENIRALQVPVKGTILATADAKPLYNRAAFESRWGGFTTYQGYSNSFRMATAINTGACNAECLKARLPLTAPNDAETRGYWTALSRSDGSKQWAYKGFALYTYAGDKAPGIVTGSNVTDYIIGDDSGYKVAEFVQASAPGRAMGLPAGFYWYVARP
jgi:predicted lipoprotein with Yx(FWY)xxD motif